MNKTQTTVLGIFITGSLLLSACGTGTQTTATDIANLAQETSFSAAAEAASNWETVDPRTINGVTNAATIGDVTPIAEEVTPQLPVQLTDADGHNVTVTDVSRILPLDLYGTTSRTIAGLGLRNNIIGRTVSSQEPSLAELPVVTQGGHNINVEAVLNLRPTLVLVDHSIGPATAIEQIRDAGITVVVLNPDRQLNNIGTDITTIARVVGLPEEGQQLAERAERERDQAIQTVANLVPDDPLRLAFVYARGTGGVFFILGPDSGTTDLFTSVGATDTAAGTGISDMTPATAEALVKLNPEVIVMMTGGLESTGGLAGMLAKPGVADTTAGQNQRIVAIPDSQALSFGPQTGEMILAFAQALYTQ